MSTYDFDATYSAITGESGGNWYIPNVLHDNVHDILIDEIPPARVHDWHALTGYTLQYGYGGAVMHASETMSDDLIRDAVRDAGGDVFAIVEVSAHDDDDPVFPDEPDFCVTNGCAHQPAGWAVIYRKAA